MPDGVTSSFWVLVYLVTPTVDVLDVLEVRSLLDIDFGPVLIPTIRTIPTVPAYLPILDPAFQPAGSGLNHRLFAPSFENIEVLCVCTCSVQ